MKHHAIHMLLLPALAAGTLVSCQTTAPTAKPTALQSGHWKLVQSKPPTWFPKDVPSDHPTNVRDGYWVLAGDDAGTRFFIPVHGTALPTEQLIAQAHTAMTPEARKDLERRRAEGEAMDAASYLTGRAAAMVIAMFVRL